MDDALTLTDRVAEVGDVIDAEPCFALTGEGVAYLATHAIANAPADPEGSL